MKQVLFELYHFKIRESQEYDEDDINRKVIGIYSDEAGANAAIDRVKDQDGFRDWPEGFRIFERWLDHDNWTEGFYDPSADDTWPKTDAEVIAEIGGPFKPVTRSADLQFSGHRCDPATLNTAMGYGLTKGWKKDDRIFRDNSYVGLREKTGFCTFDSTVFCESDDINDHIAILLWKFGENVHELQSIIDRDGVICSIACYFDDQAEAATWQPTAENLATSARLAIPIRIADIGTASANDAPLRSSSIETEEGSAEALSEQPSSDADGQPSRYLGT